MSILFESLAPLAVNFTRAAELTSMSKNSLRRLAKTGQLKTVLVGRRRVIPYDALKELVGAERSAAAPADSRS